MERSTKGSDGLEDVIFLGTSSLLTLALGIVSTIGTTKITIEDFVPQGYYMAIPPLWIAQSAIIGLGAYAIRDCFNEIRKEIKESLYS